jgi:hypothetical protein
MTFTATPEARRIDATLPHAPATRLVQRLEELRAEARVLSRIYLPGPHRTAALRRNEREQVLLLAKLRTVLPGGELLGLRARFGGAGMRPAWETSEL